MGLLKIVLAVVLLAQVCHALEQSFGEEIKSELLRRLAVDEAENADEDVESRNETEAGSKRSSSSLCRLYEVTVNAHRDFGWTWLIAPKSFKATYCKGQCPYPTPNHLQPTDHAILQTLIHAVDKKKAPGPCCVPTEFTTMSMLSYDRNNKVTYDEHKDLIATKCGCR